jgi:holin-like protein
MTGLRGLAWLLVFQSIGEALSRGLSLPLPGPVLGMMLMLVGLRFEQVRGPVGECAGFLLQHLSLLFIPVGVGVMTHLALVSEYGGRMLFVIALSTWIGLGVTALVLYWPDRKSQGRR